jgi:porin
MRIPPPIIIITFAFFSSALGQEAPDESLAETAEALEEGATLFPIPDYSSGILTRDALTGDWNGIRTSLAEDNGLQIGVDVNQFYQGVWDGGTSSNAKYNGSAYYGIKLDTAKAGLWPGGFLDIRGETYWGESVNGLTGAVLPVNVNQAFNEPAGNGTYLPHVIYTQFFSEKFAIFLGKLNGTLGDSNSFAHGAGDQRFMNLGFSLNPVGLINAPYAPLGAGFIYVPFDGTTWSFSVMDTDGKIDESGFDTVFNGNTTFSTEIGLETNFFDQPGHHTFGGLYSNKEFNSVNQDPRLFLPPDSTAPANTADGSWALIYNFDQFLVSDPDDPEKGWGLFGRFGISDGDANLIHQFYSIGLGGRGLIPGRDRDRFGLGYYYLKLSDARVGLATDDSEQGIELFYNLAVTPAFEMTADLQVIDGAVGSSDTAVVGGLRGRIRF